MLERMENGKWTPVVHDVGLNSNDAALIREFLEEKIAGGVSHYLPLYRDLKRKVDALPF